jgi:hypothetical protein
METTKAGTFCTFGHMEKRQEKGQWGKRMDVWANFKK